MKRSHSSGNPHTLVETFLLWGKPSCSNTNLLTLAETFLLQYKPSYSGGNLLTPVKPSYSGGNLLTVTHILYRYHTDIMIFTFMAIFTFVWDMVLYCDHVIIEWVPHIIPLLNPANIPSSRSIPTRHNICVTDILTLDCSMHAHIWHYNLYQRKTDPIIQWNTRNAQIMSKEHCTLHPFVTVFMNCTWSGVTARAPCNVWLKSYLDNFL